MILPDFKDFPQTGRILGVDWGAKRIGIAISDATWEFFWPRPVIENRPWSRIGANAVADLAKFEKLSGIVLGLPLRGDGSESDTTRAVRTFATEISSFTDLPIIFINENLTSFQAADELAGLSSSDMKKQLDSHSAMVILSNAVAMLRRTNLE